MNTQPPLPPTNGATPDYLTQVLRQARLRIQALEARDHAPVAVVGMGCRFPGAATPLAFWQQLLAGYDAISEVPADRWDAQALYTPTPTPGKMNTRWGGFLDQIDEFDAAFFGISGREAAATDPQQRLLLEVAWEAIEDAGIDPQNLAGSQTGVFIGISANDYLRLQRGTPHELTAYTGVGNALSIAANRISYAFDLHGPSLAIDTACSSALVAVHHACQSLRREECDQALVGGVNLILSPALTIAFSQAGMMAADGRCKTFDARADGYVRSEGAGMIFLKRLSDALRDGDPIWGVIAGSAINQDGRSNGLTAPNGQAQQAVIRQALHNAQLTPDQISYVETHGTGTALGDPIEVSALKAVLLEGRQPDQPCWLGAVKANIGHLEAAAGIAGLIKAILCLHEEQIPRQLHLEQFNPHLALNGTPLHIPLTNQPWPRGDTARFAGVSAFGFGGANAHVVLTEAPLPPAAATTSSGTQHLFTLAAKSQPALRTLAQQYATQLAADPTVSLAALCRTVSRGRAHFTHRLALVVNDNTQLQQMLAAFAAGQPAPELVTAAASHQRPRLAFLFTGQGAQLQNAGRQLYATCPPFRRTLDHCDELLRPYLAESLITLLYKSEETGRQGTGDGETGDGETGDGETGDWEAQQAKRQTPNAKLQDTVYAQPLLFALEYALAQLWIAWGIQPDMVLGHSIGELVAACVAGAFSLEEGLWLAAMRGRLMGALPADGAMAAVFADVATVTPYLQPVADQVEAPTRPCVTIAAINGTGQTVIAGERSALLAHLADMAAHGLESRLLPVHYAFHSPLMEPLLQELAQIAGNLDYQPLQIPLVSTYTGELLPVGHRFAATHWRDHAREPVRFTQGLDGLLAHGCRFFVEIGPQPLLTALGKVYQPDPAFHWLPSLMPTQTEWASLYNTLAALYVHGVPVNWAGIYAETDLPRLRLPTYPFQRQRYWLSDEDAMLQMHQPTTRDLPPRANGPTSAPSNQQAAILADLRTTLTTLLCLPTTAVQPETPFVELGADSIILREAVRQIQQRYGVTIAIRHLFEDLSTLTALSEYIAQQLDPAWSLARPSESAPVTTASIPQSATITYPVATASPQAMRPGSTTQLVLEIIAKQLELLTHTLLPQSSGIPTAPSQPAIASAPVLATNGHVTHRDFLDTPPATRHPQHVPLTEAQQQLWFLSQLNDAAALAYNESVSLWLQGSLDVAQLQAASQQLVDRHTALRTRISPTGEAQEILPSLVMALPVVDLCADQTRAQTEVIDAWLTAESQRLLDLTTGPLFRVNLLRVANDSHVLVMTAHHIIMDGWSMNVLVQELSTLYSAAVQGQAATLPSPVQFREYIAWQADNREGDAMNSHEAYWLQSLSGELPLLELPIDHARPPVRSYRGAIASVRLNPTQTQALQQLSRQQGVTLFMTLFAAYATLLHRLSGQDEVIIGIPTAGRAMPGSEQMVGYCAHLLPIRHTLTGDPAFSTLLQTMRTTLLTAYEHQDYPFARLLNKLKVVRDLSLAPVISSTFNLTRQPTLPPFAGLTATLGPRPTSFVDHELSVNIVEHAGELIIDFEYNRDLFEPATVARIAGHFTTLLAAISQQPDQPTLALPLLTVAERQQLLVEWNATALPFDTTASFQQLFEAQVARTPEAVAVLFGAEAVTYAELNAQANRIAHRLRSDGVGVDTVVAILCERSPAFVAAMLGIFKAGGAYLPLDLRAPAARQAQILAQSRTPLLLVTDEFALAGAEAVAQVTADQSPRLVRIEDLLAQGERTENLPLLPASSDPGARLAYVIYTSGSTGLPKGAMVEHRGMINHLYAKIQDLQLTAADIVAQTAPQSFDISVWQFLSTLILGGRIRIFPDAIASDPVLLLQATADHAITILEVVPSLLRTMVEELAQGTAPTLTTLRYLIPTGEALPPNLARQWLRACPHIPLVNAYGPTECSDDVTHYFVLTPPDAGVVNMPIGRPILNMRMYILDAYRQPVPIGVAGELYVGGVGVGRGYIHDPERTANAFVRDPFSADPHARLYKTGDKARYLADGTIEYLGRLDYQVKIRGFRIELGEIEAVLEAHPAVRQAVVMDRTDQSNNKYLVAYLTPQDPEQCIEVAEVRAFVKQRLPEYMAPALLMPLETLPLTNNGKIDRKALPVPDDESWGASVAYVAPQNERQQALVNIWAEVLKLNPATIGIHHSFFELGGHSLLAGQIIARVRTTFAVELPIRELMEQPTIAGMESCLHSRTARQARSPLLGAHQPAAASTNGHEVFDL